MPKKQIALDRTYCARRTANKDGLGNAIIGVSLATPRLGHRTGCPFYRYVARECGTYLPCRLNIINGGVQPQSHRFRIQILPVAAQSSPKRGEGVRTIFIPKGALKKAAIPNVGDEGRFSQPESPIRRNAPISSESVEIAGYKAGDNVFLALDCAATNL